MTLFDRQDDSGSSCKTVTRKEVQRILQTDNGICLMCQLMVYCPQECDGEMGISRNKQESIFDFSKLCCVGE